MIESIFSINPTLAISFDLVSFIALVAIVLVGLPHGAFDGAVALALGYGKTLQSMFGFIVVYILIAALVVVFWVNFSDIALLLFLAISIWHFGIGDSLPGDLFQRAIQALGHGGLVVVGISVFHTTEVDLIFAHLVSSETEWLWQFIYAGAFILVIVLVAYLVLAWRKPELRVRFFELLGLGIVYYILPPLAAFALYFCVIHSARHLGYTWGRLRALSYPPSILILLAVSFTLVTWGVGIVIFWLMPTTEIIDGAILQIIFIGLAALTVPHMLLVDGLFRRSQ